MPRRKSTSTSAVSNRRSEVSNKMNDHKKTHSHAVRSPCSSASSSIKRADQTIKALKTKSLDELMETMSVSSSHWDTDLEDDDELGLNKETDNELYEKVCEKLGVTPVSRFSKTIGQEEVKISHRYLKELGAKAIASVLVNNNTTLKVQIESNDLSPRGGVYMGKVLQRNSTLIELNLANNNINKEGIRAIAEALSENTVIKRLDLSGNGLTDKDSKILSDAVENNTSLRYLNLSYNKLGEISGQHFGSALSYNNGLVELNLSWNNIRRKGAEAINQSLRYNDVLEKLDLSWNGFDDYGTGELTDSFKRNNTLIELNLSNNRLSDIAVMNIGQGLDGNSTLEVLDMSHNSGWGGCEGIKCILQCIRKKRCALQHLKILDIQINKSCEELITACLKQDVELKIEFGCKKKDSFVSKKSEVNPIDLLKEYLHEHKIHSSDLFKQLDINGQFRDSLTREEFVGGMKRLNVIKDQYLEKLVELLDSDGDGEVDYSEFVKLS
ncbi:leucine-rich repeat-containing protein 74B-like [Actinia tenebrosa]|uniref:Leucine-rich repeat-containing protein 74B-like n=1 Tax=Actinia tenebrosa TaxID=6105 RepID=A0A6P8HKG9_ACTTE|nr:leucine-rich repeat-containing protein 74B-like [Actinia tenebrosa]